MGLFIMTRLFAISRYYPTVCHPGRRFVTTKSNDSKASQDAAAFCIKQVRQYDRENYLASLLIDDISLKRAVFALRAFNVELSLIRDQTTNSDRAKIRFHFWSKLVDEIIDRNGQDNPDLDKSIAYYKFSPLAKELLDLFHLIEMDRDIQTKLQDLIGSRLSSKVLGYKDFDTMEELETYCNKSNGSVYYLSSMFALQADSTYQNMPDLLTHIKDAANCIGAAHGLSNIIRGIRYNASQNCCYIPKDLLNRFECTKRDIINTKNSQIDIERTKPVVEYLACRCQRLLSEAANSIKLMPNNFRVLFLPRVSIQENLKKLKKCNYELSNPLLESRDNLLPLKMWLSSKYYRLPISLKS